MKNYIAILVLVLFLNIFSGCNEDNSVNSMVSQDTSNFTGTIKVVKSLEGYNNISFSEDGKYYIPSINEFWPKDPQLYGASPTIYNNYTFSAKSSFPYFGNPFECSYATFSKNSEDVLICGICYNGWFGKGTLIWDLKNNTTSSRYGINKRAIQAEYIDDRNLVIINESKVLCTYDLLYDSVTPIKGLKDIYSPKYFNLSKNGKYIFVQNYGCIADISTNPAKVIFKESSFGNFLPDNQNAIICRKNNISFFNLDSGLTYKTITDSSNIYHYFAAVSGNGKFFATTYVKRLPNKSSYDCGIQIWETATFGKVCSINNYTIFTNDTYDANNTGIKLGFVANENQLYYCDNGGTKIFQIDYKAK